MNAFAADCREFLATNYRRGYKKQRTSALLKFSPDFSKIKIVINGEKIKKNPIGF